MEEGEIGYPPTTAPDDFSNILFGYSREAGDKAGAYSLIRIRPIAGLAISARRLRMDFIIEE